MKVAVIGGGAVGLGLGNSLLASGTPTHFLVRRAEAADLLRRRGVTRTGIFGCVTCAPERLSASTSWDALAAAAPDFVLVCTKTTTAREVARSLSRLWPRFETPPAVVLCHNGWGSAEHFTAVLPQETVFNARVITGFHRHDDATVEITVHAQPVRIGSLFGASARRLAPLARAIDDGGIPCELTESIERDLFAKLLYNCALNPLAALRDVPYGGIGDDPASREVLTSVVEEIFDVLRHTAHETHWATAAEYLDFFWEELLPPTREHESSMLLDLRAGRETEIDALCGAVVRLGESAGIETPVNRALMALVRAIEPGTIPAA